MRQSPAADQLVLHCSSHQCKHRAFKPWPTRIFTDSSLSKWRPEIRTRWSQSYQHSLHTIIDDGIIPFAATLLSTSQQRLPMLFSGPDDPQHFALPIGGSRPLSNTWFLGCMRVSPRNTYRLVQPLLQSTSISPTNRETRHTDHSTPSVAKGSIQLLLRYGLIIPKTLTYQYLRYLATALSLTACYYRECQQLSPPGHLLLYSPVDQDYNQQASCCNWATT